MNEAELRDVVLSALGEIAPEIDLATLDPGTDLAEQADIDSMDFLELVVALHERTGVEIPERDYPKLATLEGAVAYLRATRADG